MVREEVVPVEADMEAATAEAAAITVEAVVMVETADRATEDHQGRP